jgi:hypothetical protein
LAHCDDGKISRLTRSTTVTLRFRAYTMSRLPPHASRARIAAKYQGGHDISLAYLRECLILDPASQSGARLRPEWNARYVGKAAG